MSEPVTTPPGPPAKRRGCFGLAFKSVLGCAAFAIGSLVALFFCLPNLCEGLARTVAEKRFEKDFRGSLTVGDLDLSWWNEQEIRDAVLLDPEKREVARISAVVPSIFDVLGQKGPMRLRAVVDADLVADDAGVTNLERALELRQPAPKEDEPDTESSDPLAQLLDLDLEAELVSRRLSWSDPETRRKGTPFEIRDLKASLIVKPGRPITLRAGGQVVSDVPGALELEATLHGPIEIGKSWPVGPVDANVRVEGFSTAMIDGVAGLRGKLVEVVGPTFDLKVQVAGATPERGDLDLGFSSQRTSFALAGTFEGGFLRTRDAAPVRLSLGVPKGFVNDLLAPSLPPRIGVSWQEGERPWVVTVANLALPIPNAGGTDLKGLARTFERLACDVELGLPAHVAFESEETRAAGVRAAVGEMMGKIHVAPGEPVTAKLEAALDTGSPGRVSVDASVKDLWKGLANGEMPVVDANVLVEGVSTRAIDALAGQGGRLEEAIGPSILIRFGAHDASPSSGTLSANVASARLDVGFAGAMEGGFFRSTGEQGLDLSWEPPEGWIDAQVAPSLPSGSRLTASRGTVALRVREIAFPLTSAPGRPLTEQLSGAAGEVLVDLPGATWTSEGMSPMKLGRVQLTARVQTGGSATLSVETTLDTGSPGRLAVDASAANAFAGLSSPFEAKVVFENVSTGPIDAFVGRDGLVAKVLGPSLTLTADAKGSGTAVRGTVHVATPTTDLRVAATLEGRRVRASGEDGVFLSARPPAEALSALIAPFLPQGAALSLGDSAQPIEVEVREIAAELPAPGSEPATLALVEGLSCDVAVRIGALRYADESTRAAKIEPSLRDLELSARVAPSKPLALELSAGVSTGPTDGEGGKLDASVAFADPWFFLRGEGAKLPPVDADVRLTGFPVAVIDGLAGKPGIASGLLGEHADLEVKVQGAGPDAGSFRAKVTSPSASVALAARLDQGVVVAAEGPALDATATLSQAWLDAQLGPMLPSGARVAMVDAKKPLRVVVEKLRLPLPEEAMSANAFSSASMQLDVSVPDFEYSDPKTAQAETPATLRDLKISAVLAPGNLPAANVSAKIESEPAGEIGVAVRALDPPAMLAEENGLERFRLSMDASAKAVPTGLVDALAGQEGLLVDVLGPRLDLALHTDGISMSDGTFTASLESAQAKVVCDRGGMKDGVLYLEKVQGKNEALLARAGLTPLFSERVVGSLVPTFVDLRKPDNEPVTVAVDDLRLPLDADLSKLDANVRVNLGEVAYRLLPGLDGLLGGSDAKTVRLPEIRVPIQKGIASYDRLPLQIGGRDYVFKGTFSLVDKTFKMETEVPLAVLGKKVSDKLESLRGVLDPKMMVPLELRGTWKSPKLRVGDDFLKRVAEDALKRQGEGLLEGLLKKKKKD